MHTQHTAPAVAMPMLMPRLSYMAQLMLMHNRRLQRLARLRKSFLEVSERLHTNTWVSTNMHHACDIRASRHMKLTLMHMKMPVSTSMHTRLQVKTHMRMHKQGAEPESLHSG